MVLLRRREDKKALGYLDDPKCTGPIEPGKFVEFVMWHRGGEFFHEDPGPTFGVPYPPKLNREIIPVHVVRLDNELCLMIEARDEKFVRTYPDFRPVGP